MKDERLEKMRQEYEEIPISGGAAPESGGRNKKRKSRKRGSDAYEKKSKVVTFVKAAGGAVVAAMLAITNYGKLRGVRRERDDEDPGHRRHRGGGDLPGV